MKKILSLISLCFLSLHSISNEQIADYFKSQAAFGNITVEIKKRQRVPEYLDFEFVVVEIGEVGQNEILKQELNVLVKDGFIFPEVVDIKNGVSLRQKVEDRILYDNLANIYKNEEKSNIIFLGNAKKPTLVIFSDPECSSCKKELFTIEDRLKTNSIKIILTPIHDLSALEKSAIIYQECAKVKTDKQKIDILKKYYNENMFIGIKISEDKVKRVDELRQKYFKAGIQNVPTIIEERNILNK